MIHQARPRTSVVRIFLIAIARDREAGGPRHVGEGWRGCRLMS